MEELATVTTGAEDFKRDLNEPTSSDMGPELALPLPLDHCNEGQYINDLLSFIQSSDLFQWLCGGVHILDFFAREPSLYDWLLDKDWRDWFALHDLNDLIDFVLREDLSQFSSVSGGLTSWRKHPPPPASLIQYLSKVRSLSLNRKISTRLPRANDTNGAAKMPRSLSIGMEVKKIHEVEQFARYAEDLSKIVSTNTSRPITHFVDFGSGQNYLGRTMASRPLNKHVIAVESKHENIEGARKMDISANLAPKTGIIRNKKDFRKYVDERAEREGRGVKEVLNEVLREDKARQRVAAPKSILDAEEEDNTAITVPAVDQVAGKFGRATLDRPEDGTGSVKYVEYRFENGNLESVIGEIVKVEDAESQKHTQQECEQDIKSRHTHRSKRENTNLMVMSIHSCGNLTHHGLRSIILNPSVTAVAMVGCCYNLLTDRLPPPSYKLPNLRPRDKTTRAAGQDVHGFPMSRKFCEYKTNNGTGVHFNVTARMMAVQAPLNWTPQYSAAFFTRHFYRALLQRIFLDRGIAEAPASTDANVNDNFANSTPEGKAPGRRGQPIVVGSLRKAAYLSFTAYVRAAVVKLSSSSNHHPSLATTPLPALIAERMADITDEQIHAYETEYLPRKKELSTVWTLMAYSAQLVEACIVVDRWQWLREQEEVGPGRCWVENVFDYEKSPRNMVVVGIKKSDTTTI